MHQKNNLAEESKKGKNDKTKILGKDAKID
jgi:hypothetical protein